MGGRMTMVNVYRLDYLEQCAADLMAMKDSINPIQAIRNLELAVINADNALKIITKVRAS